MMLRKLWNDLRQISWFVVGLGVVFLAVGALGWIRGYLNENLSAELVGIGVTVIIIDTANRWSNVQQEKKRLIRQMGGPDNGLARQAVRELRAEGWLTDGSLKNANLFRANLRGARMKLANLEGANLFEANLEGVRLWDATLVRANLKGANLEGADLNSANLRDAVLTDEQPAMTKVLWGATMPDGSRYEAQR